MSSKNKASRKKHKQHSPKRNDPTPIKSPREDITTHDDKDNQLPSGGEANDTGDTHQNIDQLRDSPPSDMEDYKDDGDEYKSDSYHHHNMEQSINKNHHIVESNRELPLEDLPPPSVPIEESHQQSSISSLGSVTDPHMHDVHQDMKRDTAHHHHHHHHHQLTAKVEQPQGDQEHSHPASTHATSSSPSSSPTSSSSLSSSTASSSSSLSSSKAPSSTTVAQPPQQVATPTPPAPTATPVRFNTHNNTATNANEAIKRYKITIIGDEQSGKTSLLSKYLFNSYNPQYNPTIGIDFKSTTIYLSDTIVKFQLWDISGQPKFRILLSSYVRDTTVCLVVFDVTNKLSYENVFSYWLPQLRNQRNDDLIIIVVGTKIDLTFHRVVGFEEAKARTQEMNLAYIETSSLTGKNVSALFQQLATILPEIDEKAVVSPTAGSNGPGSGSGVPAMSNGPKLVKGDDYMAYDGDSDGDIHASSHGGETDDDELDGTTHDTSWLRQCGTASGNFLKIFQCW